MTKSGRAAQSEKGVSPSAQRYAETGIGIGIGTGETETAIGIGIGEIATGTGTGTETETAETEIGTATDVTGTETGEIADGRWMMSRIGTKIETTSVTRNARRRQTEIRGCKGTKGTMRMTCSRRHSAVLSRLLLQGWRRRCNRKQRNKRSSGA